MTKQRNNGKISQPSKLSSAARPQRKTNVTTSSPKVHQESGTDFVTSIRVNPTVIENDPNASVLAEGFVSPLGLPASRLKNMSLLYEKYRFKNFTLRYVPSVPTSLACQLVMYCDTDPTDDPGSVPNHSAMIRSGMASAGARQFNFNGSASSQLPINVQNWLFCSGETGTNAKEDNVRLFAAGKWYILQVSDCINFNGDIVGGELVCGSLYVDWTVEFSTAELSPDALSVFQTPITRTLNTGVVYYIQNNSEEVCYAFLAGVTNDSNLDASVICYNPVTDSNQTLYTATANSLALQVLTVYPNNWIGVTTDTTNIAVTIGYISPVEALVWSLSINTRMLDRKHRSATGVRAIEERVREKLAIH